MAVYSFTCSTPDDWSNWHFLVKTFGPALMAGFIAVLAYRVANTQKTIATNKYNLDMFDKRWSVFEDFYKEYKFYNEIHIMSDFFIGEKINIMKKILLKAERFFEDITILDFYTFQKHIVELQYVFATNAQKGTKRAEIELYYKKHLPILEENYKIAIQNSDLKSKDSIKEKIDEIELYLDSDELKQLYEEKAIALKSVNDYMQTIYDRMNRVLKVPHKPY